MVIGAKYITVPWGNQGKRVRLYYGRILAEELARQKKVYNIDSSTFCNDEDFPVTVGYTIRLNN